MSESFAGYKLALPGDRVYVSDLEVQGQPMQALLMPTIFTAPTETEVINYLVDLAETARASRSLVLPRGLEEEKSQTLEGLMKKLPLKVLDNLRRRDEEIIKFITANTPAQSIPEGETPNRYAQVGYGIIPVSVIDDSRTAGAVIDHDWYEAVLDQLKMVGLGERLSLRWEIKADILAPKDQALITVINETYGKVKEVTDQVYNALTANGLRFES